MESKYIIIKEVNVGFTSVTKVFQVFSKSGGTLLGTIKWYGSWRSYTFMPEGGTVWSTDCLAYVNEKITTLMAERKAKETPAEPKPKES